MEAKELRIGNYVKDINGNIIEVESIGIDGINLGYDNMSSCGYSPDFLFDDICPIELTEEWLLMFGIGKQNGYPYKYLNGYLKIRNGIYFFKYYDLEVELPFVHSLQNLQYALKDKELTLIKCV